MDEFDTRLRERLLALAEATPKGPARLFLGDAAGLRRRLPIRTALPIGGAAVAVALVLAVIVMQLRPGPVGTASAVPSGANEIRWFIGLGSGTAPAQVEAEKAFVRSYNQSHPGGPVLKVEIVPNTQAYDALKTEIALGNPPDIVGPVGTRGRNGFGGLFLDLAPLIEKHETDLSGFDQAVIDYLKQGSDGQIGLPYLIYPGYLFYNKDIFEKAGLAEPPHRVGEKYEGQDWTWDTLATLAERLTLDTSGRDATEAGFDWANTIQYGLDLGYADARRMASTFGGGSLVAPDGTTARIPDVWAHAWSWYHDAMWKYHFVRHAATACLLLMDCDSPTAYRGRVAMETSWTWEVNSYGTPNYSAISHWDIAVLPSYNGHISSPLDADTFVIPRASRHPDQAYQAMLDIMADPGLQAAYGGIPARIADRSAYFARLDASLAGIFPDNHVDWSVIDEMAKYPTVPSHEADLPYATQALELCSRFYQQLQIDPDMDVPAALARLKTNLQQLFDTGTAPTPTPGPTAEK